MVKISNARYIYIHNTDNNKFHTVVDTHHVVARNTVFKSVMVYLFASLIVSYASFLHFHKGTPITTVIWSLFFGAFLVKLLIWRPIVKESIVIMPAFGVQLETHYGSGRIRRRFIPESKILKPVLNECVTPITCFWCLSLLVRDEDELTLVFKKFRPPLGMLVPIWKALCAAADCKESSVPFQEDELVTGLWQGSYNISVPKELREINK